MVHAQGIGMKILSFFSKYFCQNIFRNKISMNKLCPQAVLKQNSNILICYKSIRIESGVSLPLSLRWVWVESVLSQFWVWIESGLSMPLSLRWVCSESILSLYWVWVESELSMAWVWLESVLTLHWMWSVWAEYAWVSLNLF